MLPALSSRGGAGFGPALRDAAIPDDCHVAFRIAEHATDKMSMRVNETRQQRDIAEIDHLHRPMGCAPFP